MVVDTNLVVSKTISETGAAAEIIRSWRRDEFELVVATPILEEYQHALAYERVRGRHGLGDDEIRAVVAEIGEFAILVEARETPAVIADDPDDDKFLWCADAAGATCIISYDDHLLRLGRYKDIQILSPAAFLALLRSPDAAPSEDPGSAGEPLPERDR